MLPSLFVSHGSPMFAIESSSTAAALAAWSAKLAPPKAIVVMSAHWLSRGLKVQTTPKPKTWHDFGGFPEALYQLQYPAQGDSEISHACLDLLHSAGLSASADAERPFDHGAWVPLLHLYPAANIPIIQISIPTDYTPQSIYAIGEALAPLREQYVLLVGSGSMTHNLGEFRGGPMQAGAEPYVLEFRDWVHQKIAERDVDSLFHYRRLAPHAVRAHPTDEHFIPLYFALGAAKLGSVEPQKIEILSHEVQYGFLAMDAIALR